MIIGLPGFTSLIGSSLLADVVGFGCSACLACLFSANGNCFIYSWYSRTVLHGTNFISLGLDFVTTAKSFFLITVFFLLFVSNVIVVGE